MKLIRNLLRIASFFLTILATYLGGRFIINILSTKLPMLTIGGILAALTTIVGLFILWVLNLFILMGD